MSAWEDATRTALVYRITDDGRYCTRRLGRVPTEAEVIEAIERSGILPQAVEALAETLDPFESSLWDALGDDDE